MLTLQELKQVVGNREERRKVPSAKYLRENVQVIMERFFLYLPVEIMYMKQEEK